MLLVQYVKFSYIALILLICGRPLAGPGMLYLDHSRTLTGNSYLPRVPCDDQCLTVDFQVDSDVARGSCLTV